MITNPFVKGYLENKIKKPTGLPGANYASGINPFVPQNAPPAPKSPATIDVAEGPAPTMTTNQTTVDPGSTITGPLPTPWSPDVETPTWKPADYSLAGGNLPTDETSNPDTPGYTGPRIPVADGPAVNMTTSTTLPPYDPNAVNTPAKLVDPGAISEAGSLYEGRVTDALQGKDQASLDMTERANTQASRNLYMANQQGQEDALAGGLDAGSLQYQRTQDRALAGAREANLAGAQGLGDYLRTRAEDILTRGKGVEDSAYNRATGERDEAGALRLENRGNVDNYINSFGDAKFKNYLRSVQAAGGDVYAAAAGGMTGGTINEEFRSQDPVQAAQESAASWVRATQPGLEDSDPDAFQAEVVKRMTQTDKSITNPLTDEEKRVAEADAITAWTAGDTLTDAQKQAIIYGNQVSHSTTLPTTSTQIDGIFEQSPAGLFVVGSQLYQLSKRRPTGATGTYNYTTSPDGDYMILYNNAWEPADPETGRRMADLPKTV